MNWSRLCINLAAAIGPCLVLAGLPGVAQAGPVRLQVGLPATNQTQAGALLDYLSILSQRDPNFVETAVAGVLDSTSFMDGVTNPADVSTPDDIQKFLDDYNKKVIKDVEAAIKKLIEDAAKDIQLPTQEPVAVDVEVQITDMPLELLVNPYEIIQQVKTGSLPIARKLHKAKPPKIKPKPAPPLPPLPPHPAPINFSLVETLVLLDEHDVATISLTRASIRLFQVPTPSTLALAWLALLGCWAVSRSVGARRGV